MAFAPSKEVQLGGRTNNVRRDNVGSCNWTRDLADACVGSEGRCARDECEENGRGRELHCVRGDGDGWRTKWRELQIMSIL